jgi:YidC/Oxa1 family membrane protein insertase
MDIFGIFWTEIIMRPMVNTLTLIYTILYNFGFSIILFTVIVRILMVPLQVRQVKQMKGMAEIQPKIKAIQDKYKDKKDKDSRQKMTSETMALYRQTGMNPIGCLGPMIIQLPIWIGLYRAIFKTVPPTPEGLANLSSYLYSWNPVINQLPINSEFLTMNLVDPVQSTPRIFMIMLPLLVGATTWLQQKMTTFNTGDARQQQTNKMMLWMMPIMFGFFTLSFPAGLAVYILFSNITGIGIQYFILNKMGLGIKKNLRETNSIEIEKEKNSREDDTENDDSKIHWENSGRSNKVRSRKARSKKGRRRN